jgi:hypothetical protein
MSSFLFFFIFCLKFIFEVGSHFCLGTALDEDLHLLCSWDHRHAPLHLTCLLRWNLDNVLPGLALNFNTPDFHLLRSQDYKCEPLCLPKLLVLELKSKSVSYNDRLELIRFWVQCQKIKRKETKSKYVGKEGWYKVYVLTMSFLMSVWLYTKK